MAKPVKRHDRDSSAPEATSAESGREAIRGDNPDYGNRVSRRAYEVYLERGGGDGRDFDDWLTAERELANGHDRAGEPRE